jgi:molecular chaperone DnaK
VSQAVLGMSVGVGLPGGGGRVKRVLEKGVPVPARKEYQLGTTKDGQPSFDLWVFEGEGQAVAECHFLGTVQLTGLPPGAKGSVRIAVSFEVSDELLLTVRAREESRGREVEVVFTTQGTSDEVRRRIDSERKRAAVGLPPGPPPGPHPHEGPAPGPGTPSPGPGLKGLWSKITGR